MSANDPNKPSTPSSQGSFNPTLRNPGQSPSVTISEEVTAYSGPIPPVDDLIRLNKAIPGAAERLIGMAEAEGKHRQQMERESLDRANSRADSAVQAQVKELLRGQVYAFILVILGLGAAVWLSASGHPVVGSVIGGSSLLSIATAFIYGRHGRLPSKSANPVEKKLYDRVNQQSRPPEDQE